MSAPQVAHSENVTHKLAQSFLGGAMQRLTSTLCLSIPIPNRERVRASLLCSPHFARILRVVNLPNRTRSRSEVDTVVGTPRGAA